jgi:hypothetical protein
MRCRALQRFANPLYLRQFLFSALLCVAPYCVPGGVRVVSSGVGFQVLTGSIAGLGPAEVDALHGGVPAEDSRLYSRSAYGPSSVPVVITHSVSQLPLWKVTGAGCRIKPMQDRGYGLQRISLLGTW